MNGHCHNVFEISFESEPMRNIQYIILTFLAISFLAIPAMATEPDEPIIHYSEMIIEIDTELELAQDYTVHIVDINKNDGDIWVEVLRDGKDLEDGDGLGTEDDPFEYVRVIEDEEDDEEDEEFLIFRIKPR